MIRRGSPPGWPTACTRITAVLVPFATAMQRYTMRPLAGAAAAVLWSLLAITGTQHVEAEVGMSQLHVGASHLWKARAFQAEDHLKALAQELDAIRSDGVSARAEALKCEAMLEEAFALHLTREGRVHQVLKSGLHVFKIVLDAGKRGVFDLSYFYDAHESKLISIQVLSVPQSWGVTRPIEDAPHPDAILVSVNDRPDGRPRCVLGFSLKEPPFAYVVRSPREKLVLGVERRETGRS
jgi:hypothetical protein